MPSSEQLTIAAAGAVFGLIQAGMGFVMKDLWTTAKGAAKDLASFQTEVAKNYVPKEDYRNDVNRVFDMLDKINDKLDGKQDRPHGG